MNYLLNNNMKRKKNEILKLTVMVHPDNDRDPSQRQGQIGRVVAFFPEKQIITVLFKDRHKGVYMPDALLTLQSNKVMLRALSTGLFINGTDCTIIMKIYRLAFIRRHKKALQLAITNNITRFYCTISCSAFLDKIKISNPTNE